MTAVAARVEHLAHDLGRVSHCMRLSPRRALAAVDAINVAIQQLQATGGLKNVNRAFKEARKETPSLRYFDYLHVHKAAMLEALAANADR